MKIVARSLSYLKRRDKLSRMLCAKSKPDIDVLMRVVGVLKRKNLNVRSVSMWEEADGTKAEMKIMVDDWGEFGSDHILNLIKKLVGIDEVNEVA